MFKRSLTVALLAVSLAAGAASAASLTYKMDPNHTDVIASWSHFGFSNPVAHFGDVDGSITYDPANVGQSSVKVTIPMSGLESHVPAFNEHLLSDDFFDAAKYPEITFVSTRVEAAGDNKLRVFGDLTLHGVSKPVSFTFTWAAGAQPVLTGKATVKRLDFGVGGGDWADTKTIPNETAISTIVKFNAK